MSPTWATIIYALVQAAAHILKRHLSDDDKELAEKIAADQVAHFSGDKDSDSEKIV